MAASPPNVESLLEEHRGRLRALALNLLRDPAAADDVMQDAWVVASEHPPERSENLPGWLRTVVRHLALRRLRGESRRKAREQVAANPERLPSAAEHSARLELQRRLIDAVDTLDEPYRRTIVWRYFDGLMPRQIAAAEGVPVGTVKTRLARGLARLRIVLDERHGHRKAWAVPLAGLFSLDDVLATATSATAGAAVGGVLMAKKIVVGLAVVALLWVGYQAWHQSGIDPATSDGKTDETVGTATLEGAPVDPEPDVEVADPALASRLTADDEIPGTTFAGRVVDEAGAGVAGARVETFYSGAVAEPKEPINGIHLLARRDRERVVAPATTCDADGYFRIDRPWRQRALLKASAEGFAPTITFDFNSGSFVEITLLRKGMLEVRVVDVDGASVRDAEVRLLPVQSRPGTIPASVRRIIAKATTDASGRVELPRTRDAKPKDVPEDEAELYAKRHIWYSMTVEVAPADPALGVVTKTVKATETEVEITVPRVKTKEHKIVDAETGLPVPGAYVDVLKSYDYMSFEHECWRRRFFADAEGIVRYPMQEGYYSQAACAPGYLVGNPWGEPIRLTRAMQIRGVVQDSGGAPVADTPIYLLISGSPFDRAYAGLPLVSAWSDADGRFSFDAKLAGPAHGMGEPDLGIRSLVAIHPDHPPAVIDSIEIVRGAAEDYVLQFPPPATIELSIVDVDGEPIVDQWVGIGRLIPRAESWSDDKDYGVDLNGLVRHETKRTDDEGRLVLGGLAPGSYRIRAENLEVIVDLEEGETKPVVMTKGLGPSITCLVLDADGAPLTNVVVNLGGPKAAAKQVDDEGRVRFDDLVPGEYSLGTYHPRYRFWVGMTVEPSETEVVLRIPAGPAKLEIQVEGLPDDVKPGYSLMTRTSGYAPKGTGFATMDEHTETTPGFTPGSGLLVVQAEGYAWVIAEFDAPAEETTTVRVVMQPSGRVSGTVEVERVKHYLVFFKRQDPPRIPDGLEYAISRSLGNVDGYAIVADDGTFDAPDLAPGCYIAEYGRWTPETEWDIRARAGPFDVKSGESIEITLRAE